MRPPPAQLTTLIGRERDLEALAASLTATRLLTLTGAGGVGKTRLAVEAAAAFDGSVWWIALAGLDDPGAIPSALAHALGVRPLPGLGELDAAIAFLRDRPALLVLDNCEHLVEDVARVASALLTACPSLSLLTTSRVPLALRGETRWDVPPLAPEAAMRLFVERAARVDRGSPLDLEAIAEICRRLEGLPLALEFAAARVAVLTPAAIARGLEDALNLLTTRDCLAEPRQRSLRASLDWSYGLLGDDARAVLRQLSVFSGGATLELVLEVCGECLPALETLVEHSLVCVERDGASVRYRLLETVRQYAREAGDSAAARDRHRDVLLAFAERARQEVMTPRQPEVLAALDPEAANLAAALDHALATDPEKALRLCLALDVWFRARARFREADDAFARALAAADPPPALRARALAAWAWIVGSAGDFARANALATEAVGLDQTPFTLLVLANHRFFTDPAAAVGLLRHCRADDEYASVRAEALLRGAAWFRQDADACLTDVEGLRMRLEVLGDRETLAWFWFEQGAVRYPTGEHAEAARLLARSVEVAGEIGEPTADRAARGHLALIDLAAGEAVPALAELEAIRAQTLLHGGSFALPWIELLVALAEAGCDRLEAARARLETLVRLDAWGAAHALAWATAELAEVTRLLGDDARQHGRRALELALALGNPWLAAKAQLTLDRPYEALAAIQAHKLRLELPRALEAIAQATGSARVLGVADRARRELGFVAWPAQHAAHARVRSQVADEVGPAAFEQGLAEGAALELDGAVAWLLRARGPRNRPDRGWESLTPAEVEVVRLTAGGLTNPQIAERLFIARATVKTHLSHVYAKLGVHNRAQLAVQAAGHLHHE